MKMKMHQIHLCLNYFVSVLQGQRWHTTYIFFLANLFVCTLHEVIRGSYSSLIVLPYLLESLYQTRRSTLEKDLHYDFIFSNMFFFFYYYDGINA